MITFKYFSYILHEYRVRKIQICSYSNRKTNFLYEKTKLKSKKKNEQLNKCFTDGDSVDFISQQFLFIIIDKHTQLKAVLPTKLKKKDEEKLLVQLFYANDTMKGLKEYIYTVYILYSVYIVYIYIFVYT